MPTSYYEEQRYRTSKRKLDEKLNEIQLRRQAKKSGYAFACFDHFEAISKIKKFEMKPKTEDWWKCWQGKSKDKKVPYFQTFVNYVDINWMNCYADKRMHFFWNFLLKFLVIIILIFLSTPTAILQILKRSEILENLGYEKLNEYFKQNQFISFIIQTYLPPIIILIINKVRPYKPFS